MHTATIFSILGDKFVVIYDKDVHTPIRIMTEKEAETLQKCIAHSLSVTMKDNS